MSQKFTFSDPGEGLQEAEILDVHVSNGDTISDGDIVLTVETDKANTDVPAPFDGTIDEVHVSRGDTVQVGDVLMTYNEGTNADDEQSAPEAQDEPDDESGDEPKQNDADDDQSDPKAQDESDDESEQNKGADDRDQHQSAPDEKSTGDGKNAAGVGKQKSKATNSDADRDDEDGGDEPDEGQSSKQEQESSSGQETADNKSRKRGERGSSDRDNRERDPQPVPAAPSTRRLAREQGVDLHRITPSGKHGRVTSEDVEAAAQNQKQGQQPSQSQSSASPQTPGVSPSELPDFTQWGETEREPLRSIRRATARNMAQSWAQIPHVFHHDIADVTALEKFRQAHEVTHGKLTLTVLVMKALVDVLKRFPRFNASIDMQNQEIVHKHYFHIGLAVATERGLLVPVIRDVDRKSVTELAAEAADIARKARNGELSRADMSGGSITVTNPGPLGGTALTPLINHPQAAILGMAQARLEPVTEGSLDDYRITARLRLPLVLGFDHRINDGADAARFVTALIHTLADPESLLLAV